MSKKHPKSYDYALKITVKIQELFEENEDGEIGIELEQLNEGDNFYQFAHALLNLVPTFLINDLTEGEDRDQLEINHMANRLVVQYQKMQEE